MARFATFDSAQFALTPAEVLQCGDGPFACPSGFTFPAFASFAQVTADRSGVHVIWNQELASGQSKVFVRNSPDGVSWTAPPVQVDGVPAGHQWWPDIASTGRVVMAVFLDSRADPAYAPDRPPGNTAQGTNPGPSVHAYVARSRDGGRTWKQRRISRQPSTPELRDLPRGALARGTATASRCPAAPGAGVLAAWTDSRDVVAGDDARPDSRENGFDVHAPCPWVPNTVAGPPVGYHGTRAVGPVPGPGRARSQHLRRVGRATSRVRTRCT